MNPISNVFTRRLLVYWHESVLIRTAAGNLVIKIAGAGLGLINAILLARMLGPKDFGVYAVAMAAMTLLGTLATLGLPSLITREVAVHCDREEWSLLKGLLHSSHRWVLSASLIFILVGALAILTGVFQLPLTMLGWISVLLIIPAIALTQIQAAMLRGLHWVVTADVPDLLFRPLVMLIGILCAYVISLPLHVNSALLLQVNAVFLSLALGVGLRVYQMPDIVRHSTSETAHLHWARSSGTFFAITTLGLLEGQIPLYALGQMARLDQAGMFQAANLVVGVVAMGLAAVNLPLQPRLAEAWARGDKAAVQRLVTETARLASIAALPVVLLMLIMPETILGLYGEQYMQAATALRILAIGQMFNALAGSCGMLLLMTGHQRVVMQGAALALLINIGAAYVFIPRYEVSGAAFAVALSIIVWNVFYVAYAMRKLGVRTFLKAA